MKPTLRAMILTCLSLTMLLRIDGLAQTASPRSLRTLPPVTGMPTMGECPHYWGHLVSADSMAQFKLARETTNVPEYNDCQRFMRLDGGSHGGVPQLRYDSIQAIWVARSIEEIIVKTPPLVLPSTKGQVMQWRFTGLVSGMTASTSRLATIGEVYGEGDYAALGIKRGFNCIVLLWGADSASYRAWMVPVDSEPECASDPRRLDPAHATRMVATLKRPVLDGAVPDVVPPVARWDRDDGAAKQHYIGIRCPLGWCELHARPAYSSSETYASPGWLETGQRRVVRQKGWYDEQYLAAANVSPGTPIQVSPDHVRGSVFPVPDLQGRTMATYRDHGWLDVAWVSLNVPSQGYKTKFNFDFDKAPSLGGARNTVALCYDHGTSNCGTGLPTTCAAAPDGGHWYARITAKSQTVKNLCVIYRPVPSNVKPPGVVRWRWTVKDDQMWISCPVGCCETSMS